LNDYPNKILYAEYLLRRIIPTGYTNAVLLTVWQTVELLIPYSYGFQH